jgi:hypothetical protein
MRKNRTIGTSQTATTGYVHQAFDIDTVVRRFYSRFKAEHAIFQSFIQGIPSEADRETYASLMLNRLIFLYFMQKKGFLDSDTDYLSNRLRMIQEHNSEHTCTSFYRHFLLPLLQQKPGMDAYQRFISLNTLSGTIPPLHCSLFNIHELEHSNPDIQIVDEAFAGLFAFLDTYQWHLDERPPGAGNEITPDILGYIFEQYVNQQQMGAYYTKKDITEYIARNTIIPFIFTAAEKICPDVFGSGSDTWRQLQENPDRYIFASVQCTNHLPAETEQEYAIRRAHYAQVKARMLSGEIASIDALITYNLDIRRFARDAITCCKQPNLLRAFYHSIQHIAILDPTCGSGAFLLAALDILAPLYTACLDRMQTLMENADHYNEMDVAQRDSMQDLIFHESSSRYFILKSIMTNNLYGVDIMQEAVEICKLRLFLALIAQIEHAEDFEALPAIDFNIRPGNVLLGFVTQDDVKEAGAFEQWRQNYQPFHWFIEFNKVMREGGFDVIIGNPPYVEYSKIKQQYTLPQEMYATEACGNLYAHCMERFVALSKPSSTTGLIVPLSIVSTSRMAPLRRILCSTYSHLWLNNYDTIPGTLFSGIVQRNTIVLAAKGHGKTGCDIYTTRSQKWFVAERSRLFDMIPYMRIDLQSLDGLVPKVSTPIELSILNRIQEQKIALTSYIEQHSNNTLAYKRRWSYFLLFADTIRDIVLPDGSTRQQQDVKTLTLQPHIDRYIFIALLSSNLFYFHYSVFSDFRHVNKADFAAFQFDYAHLSGSVARELSKLSKILMQSYLDNLEWRRCNYVGSIGECLVPFYRQGASRPIIEEIDRALAQHYGLTSEELGFVVNYDIKYRLGRSTSGKGSDRRKRGQIP